MRGPALETMTLVISPKAPLHVFIDEASHQLGSAGLKVAANGFLDQFRLARMPPVIYQIPDLLIQPFREIDL